MLLLSSADFFSKLIFSKNSFRSTYQSIECFESRSGPTICPDPSPNCLQSLSAGDKILMSLLSSKELKNLRKLEIKSLYFDGRTVQMHRLTNTLSLFYMYSN